MDCFRRFSGVYIATYVLGDWRIAQTECGDFGFTISLSINSFIPEIFTLEAYINIFTIRTFGKSLINTLIICAATIALGIIVNAPAGLIFAKYRFKGKEGLFFIIMISFMVPFEAVAIPTYQLVSSINLVDTYTAIILPTVANGLIIFLFSSIFCGYTR